MTSKSKIARDKVVQEMADAVMKAIKSGEKPWLKPWDTSKCTTGLAHNVASGKPYRGVNQFYLSIASIDIEFASYKQWAEVGRKHAVANDEWEWAEDGKGKRFKKATEYYGVQKGSSSHTVIYFTIIKKEDKETAKKQSNNRFTIGWKPKALPLITAAHEPSIAMPQTTFKCQTK